MTRARTALRPIAVTMAAVLGLAACGSGGGAGEGEQTEVTLQLNWYPYGEHAPFYYGVEQGIFADHGIDLTIEAGQGSTKTVQAVGQERYDFGWADAPALLANVEKGAAVKSVGVFLQTTPSSVQVFSDSGIEEPDDLRGKTIATSAGDAPTTTFPMYLDAVGLAEDDVVQQNLDAAGKNAAMLSGKVDGLIGFAHDQGPTIAAESGREVTYLRYSDAGLNFYSNGLVVNDSMIADDPDLVRAMVQATSEAFTAAIEAPEEAAASMDGKDPQMPDGDVLRDQWEQTVLLLETEATEGEAPGTNAQEDWENTVEVLAEAGLLGEAGGVDTYYDSSFAPAEGDG